MSSRSLLFQICAALVAGVSLLPAQAGLVHRQAAPASAPVTAPALTLKDYAVQRPIELSGRNGVVSLTLPTDAYPHITDAALRDVGIFNARGEPVAFAWYQPAPRAQVAERSSTAAIFPVRGAGQAGLSDDMEVAVKTRTDGTILSARIQSTSSNDRASAVGEALQALVLDLGADAPDEALHALVFTAPRGWREGEYRADVAVDVSDDLKQWTRVATSPLLWLRGGAATALVQDRIELQGLVMGHPRYARVQWLEGVPAQFAQVQVLRRQAVAQAEVLQESVVAPQAGPAHAPQDWIYPLPPALRVSQLGLRLPENNTVLPARIGGYRAAGAGRPPGLDVATQANFYRLTQGGQERQSGWVAVPPQSRAEWVVRPLRPSASPPPLSEAPSLMVRWKPATLVFAAQGPGPFVLALGARATQGNDTDVANVAPGFGSLELSQLEQAQLGPTQQMGAVVGPAPAEPRPAQGDYWDRGKILWAVLVLGFGVLSLMCWTLYRQLSARTTASPGE